MTSDGTNVVSEVEALPPRACLYCDSRGVLCALHAIADRGCFTCGGPIEQVLLECGSNDCQTCRPAATLNLSHP